MEGRALVALPLKAFAQAHEVFDCQRHVVAEQAELDAALINTINGNVEEHPIGHRGLGRITLIFQKAVPVLP